jgi:hypothetical protein
MGMDLSGKQGPYRLSGIYWGRYLKLALKHGWKPEGTTPHVWLNKDGTPCDELNKGNDEWGGHYNSNDYQIVSDEDARNLSAALGRAAAALMDTLITAKVDKVWADEGDPGFDKDDVHELWALCGYTSQGGFSIG